MVYYGLTMGASSLVPGDPYLNFLAVSLVEIPGYTLSYVTMNKLVACMDEYLSGPIQKPTSKFVV